MSEQKRTAVFGASIKPERYSNRAINMLREYGHPVEAIGLREGRVADVDIQTGLPELKDIHTVTMYLGPQNQDPYYDYIIGLNPRRVIFNPGTENPAFAEKLREKGIDVVESCTLIMLGSGAF
jgi:predicted CoA-binding protein